MPAIDMRMEPSRLNGHEAPPRTGPLSTCERCAAPVELLTTLERRTDHSAYRIYACTVCNFLQWIPD
jgi:DNA-directed RNA polymerase subunit M/transcription elongation factor TFIIS